MEDVHDTLNWLSQKKVYYTFDLKDEFFQVDLDEDSKPLTVVRSVLRLFHYTRLPKGLKSPPETVQRMLRFILGFRKGKDVFSYVVDISVGTETEEEHLESLDVVFTLLNQMIFRLKLSRSTFGMREVEVLGHKVTPVGILPFDGHVRENRNLVCTFCGPLLQKWLVH